MVESLQIGRIVLRTAAKSLLNWVYPPHCVACGAPGDWFCAVCIAQIVRVSDPICEHCGRLHQGSGLCATCRRGSSSLDAMRSAAIYQDPLAKAIHALKYDGVRVLVPILGSLLVEAWSRWLVPAQTIVAVPLHRSRERQRGYNQSLLLARELSRHTGIPVQTGLVVRQRKTESQVGLSGAERWDNVSDAFRCNHADLSGARILLVDDVLTSGATLESCAKVLRKAGASMVWSLTLTQALRASSRQSSEI